MPGLRSGLTDPQAGCASAFNLYLHTRRAHIHIHTAPPEIIGLFSPSARLARQAETVEETGDAKVRVHWLGP